MGSLLRGLVDVDDEHEYDKVFTRIRLIHATLPRFLYETKWVEQYMKPQFFDWFPDNFMLRFALLLFGEASSDQIITPEQLSRMISEGKLMGDLATDLISKKYWRSSRRALKVLKLLFTKRGIVTMGVATELYPALLEVQPGQEPSAWVKKVFGDDKDWIYPFELWETWRQRRTILRALIPAILELASGLEANGYSSSPFIGPAMRSYLRPWLGLMALLAIDITDVMTYLQNPEALQIQDLILAILMDLPLYFEERLNMLRLTEAQQQILGFFVIRQHWRIDWLMMSTRGHNGLSRFLLRNAVGDRPFTSEMLRRFIKTRCPNADDNYPNVTTLLEFRTPGEVSTTKAVHHHPCKRPRNSNLLLDWAMLLCKSGDACCRVGEVSVSPYRSYLDLVLMTGVDLNATCYSHGHVIHAILDYDLLIKRFKKGRPRMTEKFVSLAQRGLDPNKASRY